MVATLSSRCDLGYAESLAETRPTYPMSTTRVTMSTFSDGFTVLEDKGMTCDFILLSESAWSSFLLMASRDVDMTAPTTGVHRGFLWGAEILVTRDYNGPTLLLSTDTTHINRTVTIPSQESV